MACHKGAPAFLWLLLRETESIAGFPQKTVCQSCLIRGLPVHAEGRPGGGYPTRQFILYRMQRILLRQQCFGIGIAGEWEEQRRTQWSGIPN